MAAMTNTPLNSSHETRWPKRPSKGKRTPSTIHAHNHFRLYARKASEKAVTVFLSMPSCARRVVSVAAISAKGAPEDKPNRKAAMGPRSV